MGMFDEIRIRVPLPVEIGVDHREHWFQTKSLGSHLEFYEVTPDGVLCLIQHAGPGIPGIVKPMAYTGEVRFYTQASGIGKKVPHKESGTLIVRSYDMCCLLNFY